MIGLIVEKRSAIEELCRRFNVLRLELFGSAADGTFDPDRSDVDFLIEFHPGQNLGPWLAHYFDFKAELERLLGTRVDLVMPKAMKSPYFIREVNRTRQLLYAA